MKRDEILLSPDDPLRSPSHQFGVSVREYLNVVVGRWRLIAAICALTLGAGLLHFYLTPRLYRAQTLIQIEQRSPLALGRDSNPFLEAFLTQKYYPTQYRLLKSRELAERVVRNLDLNNDPRFGSSSSPAKFTEGADEAAQANLARRILAGLTVRPVAATELVTIDYVGADPVLAAELINTLAKEFINWNLENRTNEVDRASRFLQTELQTLRQEITEKEGQLEDYRRRSDIVTLDPASNLTLRSLERLNNDLIAAQAGRREKQAQLRELESLPRASVADEEANGLISEMRRTQLRRQNEYNTKLQVYKPDWPEMVELRATIDESERAINREIEKQYGEARRRKQAEYQTALRQERALESEIARVKSEALDLNSVSVEYNNLKMEISARRDRQDTLLQELATADMSARMFSERESNIRVIERALVPSSPFRPSLRLDLASGLTAGVALGIALALLLHFMDRTVKTPEELERLLGLPLLGVIPDAGEKSRGYSYYGYGRPKPKSAGTVDRSQPNQVELIPALHPRLAVSESYRSLRTAVLLSSAEELKVVSITSAESGEGKTATASNLGVVMAQLGKRVLIVDADLRKPSLAKIFNVSNRTGLVHYLTGTARPESLCLATSQKDLFLCPAGPHPPNPSELLASERMNSFLEFASKEFDFVIVDSPPVLAVTDAVLIGGKCQGTALCFRAHKVERASVHACRNRLQLSDVRILGAVLNRYSPSRSGYGGKYDYYYDSYGEETSSAA
ncbi:MAG: GumC family protein [Thermoanaerobaculia bacterium]